MPSPRVRRSRTARTRPGSASRPSYGVAGDDVFPGPASRQLARRERVRRRGRSASVLFTVLVLVGSITVLVTLATWATRRHPVVPTKLVPTELVGVWRTANPRYADRFLEITATSIFFQIEDGKVDGHPIVAVDESPGAGAISYTISYRDQDGQRRRVAIDYDSRRAGVIRLKHQQQIEWTRGPSQ